MYSQYLFCLIHIFHINESWDERNVNVKLCAREQTLLCG